MRVQGMQRYYALLLDNEDARNIRAYEGRETVRADVDFGWTTGCTYNLNLQVAGNRLIGAINDTVIIEAEDLKNIYVGGLR